MNPGSTIHSPGKADDLVAPAGAQDFCGAQAFQAILVGQSAVGDDQCTATQGQGLSEAGEHGMGRTQVHLFSAVKGGVDQGQVEVAFGAGFLGIPPVDLAARFQAQGGCVEAGAGNPCPGLVGGTVARPGFQVATRCPRPSALR